MSFGKSKKHSGIILAGVTTASVAASAASQSVANANIATNSIYNLFTSNNCYVRGAAYVGAFALFTGVAYLFYRLLAGGGEEQKQENHIDESSINKNINEEEKGYTNEPENRHEKGDNQKNIWRIHLTYNDNKKEHGETNEYVLESSSNRISFDNKGKIDNPYRKSNKGETLYILKASSNSTNNDNEVRNSLNSKENIDEVEDSALNVVDENKHDISRLGDTYID